MLDFLALVIVGVLAFLGLIWLVYSVVVNFASDPDSELCLFIFADRSCNDLDVRLYESQALLLRYGGKCVKKIIVVDKGMSEQMRQIAEKEEQKNPLIVIIKGDELKKDEQYSKI